MDEHVIFPLSCRDARLLAADAIDDDLPASMGVSFRTHLRACPACHCLNLTFRNMLAHLHQPSEPTDAAALAGRVGRRLATLADPTD